MIVLINAGKRIPSAPELDKMAEWCGTDNWGQTTLGEGDANFVGIHYEKFSEKVHGAVLRIVDEMRDEVAKELLRIP